ncbi:MAG TPA: IPT/TIG domain-containing protein [Polyangiales bacterium]|nr:IPT/TIG domain-containing protein [Polyangiales bacterium]
MLICAGCSDKFSGPTPTLSKSRLPVAPAIVCGDQQTTELTLNGEHLSPVPLNIPNKPAIALPSLTLTRSAALDGGDASKMELLYGGDSTAPSNTSKLSWNDQQEISFTIDQELEIDGDKGRMPSGIYDARVVNPNTNQATAKSVLAVVDKPTATETSPALLCLAQGERDLVIQGTGFLRIAGGLPSLRAGDASFEISALEGCTKIAQTDADAEYCETVRLTLAQDVLPPELHSLVLTNPETAACHTEEELNLRIVSAPTISAVAPDAACSLDGSQRVTIQGTGFLSVGGTMPRVKLAGQDMPVAMLASCETLETPNLTVESCTQIELDLDVSTLALGDVSIEVANPEPAGCAASASGVFRIVGPPTISAINPTDLCSDVPTVFTVTGTGFEPVTKASVDGVEATSVKFVSATELEVSMPGLSTSMHSFTVTNAGTCSATRPAALTVDPSPIVFFVDPPVTYADIPVEVTIFTSGLSASAAKVELVHDDMREELTFTNAGRPNKILAKVPGGLAAGAWDVVVTNAGGCPGTLPGGLSVTDTLTGSLVSAIKPSYASTTEDTAVTISGSGLAAVPRVYLTASGSARALRAVEVKQGGDAVTAVIPSGLAAGAYDLLVVNPDGKVDVLDDGVTITSDKPPVATSATPASLPANASNRPMTITGTGFKSGLSVELDCQTTSGMRTTVPTTEMAPSGDGKSVSVNITMSMATPTAVDAGSVCLVRLTNSDGAFFEYSAFSVTNSSLNLSAWKAAPDLQTARRALSLVAGRPTATSRYLYAIGGDSGTANQPATRGTSVFDSIEASQVDVFGTMSDWSVQRNHLTAPRTAAGAASIGRYVYLLGGHDGTSATNTLLRATILDPLAGPEISDIDAALSDGTKGLDKGLYYYRVSAVRSSGDLDNPGGETLAGELLPVQLPERAEKIAVSLKWNEVAGSHGYRIYRSPQPNAAADSLQLLGEITCGAAGDSCNCTSDPSRCRWLDDGAATQASGTPLPAGSLGAWHAVDGARCASGDCLLGGPREGVAVTALESPANASQWFLYAFGGRNASGTYLDSYEVATVSIAGDGSQTVADFAPGSDTLAVPRADFAVWVMSKKNSNVIAGSGTPDDVWVYAGGGRTTGDATNNTLEAGKLGASGVLNAFVAADPLKGGLVGFGNGASNDQLYTFGGISNNADGTSAELCSTMNCLPALKPGAFNSLGSATTRRMFTASTQESAFFFVAGGHDGSNAIKSSQRTVQ